MSIGASGVVFNMDWSFSVGNALDPIFDKLYNFALSLFSATFVDILPKIIVSLIIIGVVIFAWNKFTHSKK